MPGSQTNVFHVCHSAETKRLTLVGFERVPFVATLSKDCGVSTGAKGEVGCDTLPFVATFSTNCEVVFDGTGSFKRLPFVVATLSKDSGLFNAADVNVSPGTTLFEFESSLLPGVGLNFLGVANL